MALTGGTVAKVLGRVGGPAGVIGSSILLPILYEMLFGGEKESVKQKREQDLTREKLRAEKKLASADREAQTRLRKEEATAALAGNLSDIQQRGINTRAGLAQGMADDPSSMYNSPIPLSDIFHLVF